MDRKTKAEAPVTKGFPCMKTVQKPLNDFIIEILPDADIAWNLFIYIFFIFYT